MSTARIYSSIYYLGFLSLEISGELRRSAGEPNTNPLVSFNTIYDSTVPSYDEQDIILGLVKGIQRLGGRVNLSLRDPRFDPCSIHCDVLRTLSCISCLGLYVKPQPVLSLDGFFNHPQQDHMGVLSQIIHRNPNLHRFELFLNLKDATGSDNYERYHNLSIKPPSFQTLKELSLEGHVTFGRQDWIRWDSCLNWANLQKLRVAYLPLVLQVLSHCLHRLTNLRRLELNVHLMSAKQEDLAPLLDDQSFTTIANFLSSQTLEELDLTGLTRDIPLSILLHGSGAHMRSLRLHVNGPKKPRILRRGERTPDLQLGETAFLSSNKLNYLNNTCPYMEHLGLDVENIQEVLCTKHHRHGLFHIANSRGSRNR